MSCSKFCYQLQDILDEHSASMPEGLYLQLAEVIGDESHRALKLVKYTLVTHAADGRVLHELERTIICRPMADNSRYCLPELIRRGEYDPAWLGAEMPLSESLEIQSFVLHSVTDLELMPKRRRLEPPSPTPTPGTAPEGVVDLSRARPGGLEWEGWRTNVLGTVEGLELWRLFGADDELTPAQREDKVTDRLSTFCEVCMENYVPRKSYVLGFEPGLEIDRANNRAVPGGRNNLVCLECLPAEHPLHSWAT